MFRSLFILLVFASCSSHKSSQVDALQSVDQMIATVPMVGEGRGRVGIKGQQFVYSFDAVLNEKTDWILSAAIPLHGEELMIFPSLKDATPPSSEESFERRIQMMFEQSIKAETSAEKMLSELRHLIRFMLSAKLSLERTCQRSGDLSECRLISQDGFYKVSGTVGKKISIEKELAAGEVLKVEGESFQGSIFKRTNFYFVISGEKIFSLELIWN